MVLNLSTNLQNKRYRNKSGKFDCAVTVGTRKGAIREFDDPIYAFKYFFHRDFVPGLRY